MTERERIERPVPERTAPLRGGAHGLFGPPPPPRPTGDATADAVARAVDLGYQVVDDYLRQGQAAARLLAQRRYGPEALANDVQDLAARALQYGSQWLDVWLQLVGQTAGAGAAPASEAAPTAASGSAPAARAGVVRLALAVASPRPVEVRVELDAGAEQRCLAAQPLRTPGAEAVLADVAIESGDPPRLRLRVPPDQPPGTYAGLVLDARTQLPAGSIVVRVPAADPAP